MCQGAFFAFQPNVARLVLCRLWCDKHLACSLVWLLLAGVGPGHRSRSDEARQHQRIAHKGTVTAWAHVVVPVRRLNTCKQRRSRFGSTMRCARATSASTTAQRHVTVFLRIRSLDSHARVLAQSNEIGPEHGSRTDQFGGSLHGHQMPARVQAEPDESHIYDRQRQHCTAGCARLDLRRFCFHTLAIVSAWIHS